MHFSVLFLAVLASSVVAAPVTDSLIDGVTDLVGTTLSGATGVVGNTLSGATVALGTTVGTAGAAVDGIVGELVDRAGLKEEIPVRRQSIGVKILGEIQDVVDSVL
ncbi:hypothetical protein HGRIS_004834 [Hohenbuehelia grisea]|uniref:Uncharacterized protein n=1 Tax=Hohenbuehelia grisea TaxID=104357 RepID=A0ABR3JD42_9AGAR